MTKSAMSADGAAAAASSANTVRGASGSEPPDFDAGACRGDASARAWRLGGLFDLRAALAFGLFFAWQSALSASSFVSEGFGVLSPQLVQVVATLLAMVLILRAHFASRPPTAVRSPRACVGVAMVLGTLGALGAHLGSGAQALCYASALVMGVVLAVCLFAWVYPVARIDPDRRIGTLLLGCLLSFALMWLRNVIPAGWLHVAYLLLVGAGALGAFCLLYDRDASAAREVTYRPTRTQHYRLLMLSMIIYAFVFGSVSGSTGHQIMTSGVVTFGVHEAVAGMVLVLACLLLLVCRRTPVRLEVVGRVLTPLLVMLFLAHIVLPDAGRDWLPPITLACWQIVQVFVVLVLVEVSRAGVGSLGLVFSGGWTALAAGFAVGSLFGAASGLLFGIEDDAVTAITVMHTVLAVVASSLLAAAKYPEVEFVGSAGAPGTSPASPDAVAAQAPAPDAIMLACAQLARRCMLSERELEVLELLARGNTRQSIADRLVVSENTVRTHVKNIYAKLHIHSKQQLIDLVDGMREAA